MEKNSFGIIALLFAIIFLVSLILTSQQNQKLKSERETLLLKNDSLHMQHLISRKQVVMLRNKLDSIQHKKINSN